MLNVKVQEDESPAPQSIATKEATGHGVALALGGGVARGWSHIGTIRALDEAGIPIRMIAGTSVGALVGGCYLAGKLDELEEFARSLTPRRILSLLDISLRGTGLISGYKLAEHMEKHLSDIRIEDLEKPLVCVATEITTGHEIWLTSGPLIQAMRASYALPGIFEPVKVGNRVLVDGALVNPVPVSVCRAYESQAVAAVNLSWDAFGRSAVVQQASSDNSPIQLAEMGLDKKSKKKANQRNAHQLGKTLGLTGVVVEAFNIIQDRIARSRLAGDPPDISIRPKVRDIGLAEFHRADETIQLGYESTMREVDRLHSLAAASAPIS